MITPNRLFRSRLPYFGLATVLLTGGAFVAGRHWRDSEATLRHESSMRVAQAGVAPPQTPSRPVAEKTSTDAVPQTEKRFRTAVAAFSQVRNLVRDEYVDPLPPDTELTYGATKAMLAALEDNQSYFLMPAERSLHEREQRGLYAGIGCVTAIRGVKTSAGYTEQHLLVVAPLPGSSAQKAGLRTGDRITHLDGNYILSDNPYLTPGKSPSFPSDSPMGEDSPRAGIGLLVAQMRLRKETTGIQNVTVVRRGEKLPIKLTLQNGAGKVPAPQISIGIVHNPSAVLLKLSGFPITADTVIVERLRSVPPTTGIVLDLRQNPGLGSFDVARKIAALLIPSSANFAVEIGAAGKHTPLPMPPASASIGKRRIAVLTDGGTAGLAEALAIYLSDKGAALVGSGRTWGDGRSQTQYPLPDGSGYTLTTGKLVSPSGTEWDTAGLAPRFILPKGLTETQIIAQAANLAATRRNTVAQTDRLPEVRP